MRRPNLHGPSLPSLHVQHTMPGSMRRLTPAPALQPPTTHNLCRLLLMAMHPQAASGATLLTCLAGRHRQQAAALRLRAQPTMTGWQGRCQHMAAGTQLAHPTGGSQATPHPAAHCPRSRPTPRLRHRPGSGGRPPGAYCTACAACPVRWTAVPPQHPAVHTVHYRTALRATPPTQQHMLQRQAGGRAVPWSCLKRGKWTSGGGPTCVLCCTVGAALADVRGSSGQQAQPTGMVASRALDTTFGVWSELQLILCPGCIDQVGCHGSHCARSTFNFHSMTALHYPCFDFLKLAEPFVSYRFATYV
mmetsp:Transcript_34566/g.76805  ORF Transcript_34566/g.76805 Transcript_34566/m.76805 type:complete len:304 (-) Transcript_34566:1729-2640(-)